MIFRKLIASLFFTALLCGCTPQEIYENPMVKEASVTDRTRASDTLLNLPAPTEKIAVALYDFQDQTGQFKNNDKFSEFSSAVTKGGHAILTKALLDAGNKKWFTVIERGGLKDLIQERQIIKAMRAEYNPGGDQLAPLPPLLYGGMLIEGGIVSFDSNVITGGAGASYLGIGGNVQYRRDLVTVYLRAVSIQTGEVLASVTSAKTIFSTAVNSNVLKYITFDKLLQAEAGFTVNEPTQLCVRQAIEAGVYSLVMEGAIDKLWDFKDPVAGQQAIAEYIARRDGNPNPMQNTAQTTPTPAPASAPYPTSQTSKAVPVQAVSQQSLSAPTPAPAAPVVITRQVVPVQLVQPPQTMAAAKPSQPEPDVQEAAATSAKVELTPMSASISQPAATRPVPANSAVGYGHEHISAPQRRSFNAHRGY